MFKHFIVLQWKSFWRSASLTSGLFMKLFMGFWALWIAFMSAVGGAAIFKLIKEKLHLEPLETINKFLIYWLVFDLVFRYALQKMPVINIKPLLLLPFQKNKIVSFAFGKTVFSFFNVIHAFFFIPFSIVLISNEYPVINVLLWNLGLIALIYGNNFLNIILNKKDNLIFIIGGIMIVLGGLHYYDYFNITTYTAPFFQGLYDTSFFVAIPIVITVGLLWVSFRSFVKDLYLDAGLATKAKTIKTENLDWLDRFGKTATFLKNDIKLIKRNKRARSTVLVSVLFLFYGLLFFTGAVETYKGPVWQIFAAIFVTGGFLLSFGQFVPSWDSSYYPLMMSQNIRYKEYLSSKWWLMVIATLISTILASGYLYFGWDVYLAILVAALYNIGVNSHVVLWAGAYVKTPIDLTSNKKAFGDKQAFNTKTLLLSLPKMALPMILYAIGYYAYSPYAGYALVAIAGVAGFAFKDAVFNKIERIYRSEKYKTIAAYKQKN
ncbi:hypothetical protein D1816_16065 [Aquimarina sp. AD10]|uniref:DUF5687 family protein n=1 Tax=Aquimarina sp. AD10 TaxID=1714849 RepID=UPI000E5194EC|nr:DUF5687 family protein [Aquimarina sp. AD10]AXT61805.1 hypothetical protein D1816_16065 [Aquimarina sp. AD10]RKN02603.1 hypothetical protein D7033_00190 [Aquimarina sp. AD10]